MNRLLQIFSFFLALAVSPWALASSYTYRIPVSGLQVSSSSSTTPPPASPTPSPIALLSPGQQYTDSSGYSFLAFSTSNGTWVQASGVSGAWFCYPQSVFALQPASLPSGKVYTVPASVTPTTGLSCTANATSYYLNYNSSAGVVDGSYGNSYVTAYPLSDFAQ